MTNAVSSSRISVARIVVAGALLVSCGSYYLYEGLLVLSAGETLVAGKHFQPFVAYASGPHSGQFYFRIYTQLVFSSLAILAGLALPASLSLLPLKRKTAILNLFASSTGSSLGHAPWVAALAMSLVLLCLLVLRVLESS